jgi:hypothetical protein
MAASPDCTDPDIKRAEEQVAQQEQLVRRMIVRGTPSQSAEDLLRRLEQTLERMKEQTRGAGASKVRRRLGSVGTG